MEQIIDIAKQRLDTYKPELLSLLAMNDKITKADLLTAYSNLLRLTDAIEDILTGEE